MKLSIGNEAPDFTLYDSAKQPFHLREHRGQYVVLVFFPLAFTGTCTKQLCSMNDDFSVYTDMKATVVGISVDSWATLAKYKEELKLDITLLSDFNKEVSADYGCLYDTFMIGMKGVSKRSAFVIDPAGILVHQEVLEDASQLPDAEAIKNSIKTI